jgi:DNA-binding transcriptional LysR family regulator
MQIEAFKVFRDLVDTQSFSKAAQLNLVTQSAVSQQIRAIEDRFGCPLLERGGKRVALTREGKIFYEASRTLTAEYENLINRFQEIRKIVEGSIRVATVYSVGLHDLPPILKSYMKECPQVHIHLEYQSNDEIYENILHGMIDIGLVAYPAQRKNIKIEPFKRERLVVVVAPEHPFATRTKVSLKDVGTQKFIAFDAETPTRKAIDKIFRELNLEITPVMEFDNIEVIKRAVEIEAGISIVPRNTVLQEEKNGTLKLLEISDGKYDRPLGILYRYGRVLSPAINRFLEVLRNSDSSH